MNEKNPRDREPLKRVYSGKNYIDNIKSNIKDTVAKMKIVRQKNYGIEFVTYFQEEKIQMEIKKCI